MKFSNDELKVLAGLAITARTAGPGGVIIGTLGHLFARPCKLKSARESLERWGLITYDPFTGVARLLEAPVMRALSVGPVAQQVMFPEERPLDAARQEIERCVQGSAERVQGHNGNVGNDSRVKIFKDPKSLANAPPERGKIFENPNLFSALAGSLPEQTLSNSLPIRAEEVSLKVLKERHKGIKPLMELVSLKGSLLDVESAQEEPAYQAMCGILGGMVMEGGDLDGRGKERLGDGGKWRNRWRNSRMRVHRVFAELVYEIEHGDVKNRGGRAEFLWGQMK